jgi:hypothetical protein
MREDREDKRAWRRPGTYAEAHRWSQASTMLHRRDRIRPIISTMGIQGAGKQSPTVELLSPVVPNAPPLVQMAPALPAAPEKGGECREMGSKSSGTWERN